VGKALKRKRAAILSSIGEVPDSNLSCDTILRFLRGLFQSLPLKCQDQEIIASLRFHSSGVAS
jgi:hypothetical protein